MKIGFTGTQNGMTVEQRDAFVDVVGVLGPCEFHHGDCVGADADAAIVVLKEFHGCKVVCHPPNVASKRARVGGHVVLVEKPYLDRNRDIVDACDVLVACPKGDAEEVRSGTWYTIRYARRSGRLLRIVFPSGVVEEQR